MNTFLSLLIVSAALVGISCGGKTPISAASGNDETPSDEAPSPTSLYIAETTGCGLAGQAAGTESARERFVGLGSGEELVVVEIAFADECTDAGGQYILARELDDLHQEHWLGGHGCRFFDDALVGQPVLYGVLRYDQTAALFQISEGVCVRFPGATTPPRSSTKVDSIAIFDSRADAELFESTLE